MLEGRFLRVDIDETTRYVEGRRKSNKEAYLLVLIKQLRSPPSILVRVCVELIKWVEDGCVERIIAL